MFTLNSLKVIIARVDDSYSKTMASLTFSGCSSSEKAKEIGLGFNGFWRVGMDVSVGGVAFGEFIEIAIDARRLSGLVISGFLEEWFWFAFGEVFRLPAIEAI